MEWNGTEGLNITLYLDLSGTFATIAVSYAIKELLERTRFSSDALTGILSWVV